MWYEKRICADRITSYCYYHIYWGGVYYYFLTSKPKVIPTNPEPPAAELQESPIPTLIEKPTTEVDPSKSVQDEKAILLAQITKALKAKYGEMKSTTCTVSKIEGLYATGGASGSGGGGMWLAAKVGGIWKLVWDGNGVIYCSDVAPYPDFPKSMVPECWDNVNKKNVIR